MPSIQLDPLADLPLHRQLYNQLRDTIRSGHLKPGARLPSTRALALELDVSRTTIEAYRVLKPLLLMRGSTTALARSRNKRQSGPPASRCVHKKHPPLMYFWRPTQNTTEAVLAHSTIL